MLGISDSSELLILPGLKSFVTNICKGAVALKGFEKIYSYKPLSAVSAGFRLSAFNMLIRMLGSWFLMSAEINMLPCFVGVMMCHSKGFGIFISAGEL